MDLSMVCSRIYLVCVYGDFVSVSRCECKCICNYFLCFKHVCIDMFFMYDNMFTLEFKRLCRYAITVDKLLSYPSKETLFPPPHSPPTPTFKQPLRFPLSLPLPLSFSLPLPLLSPFLSPPPSPPRAHHPVDGAELPRRAREPTSLAGLRRVPGGRGHLGHLLRRPLLPAAHALG